MLYGIASAATALLLAGLLTGLLRVPALRLGIVDRRRSRPVPLLGGAAVVLATCLVAVAGDWTRLAPLGTGVMRLLTAGGCVAALGLAADVWRIKTRLPAVGTAVAAACVVPYDETGVPGGVLAVGWITAVALAFRGLDHVDGGAGAVGAVTAFGVGACAAVEVLDGPAALLSALAAALAGFLLRGWPSAPVGLGACGSLFTGFMLAAAAVFTRAGYGLAPSAAVLFALFAVPVADAVLVVVSRRLARRPLGRRGPDHLGHRLRRLGLTPQGTAVLLGAGAFGGGLAGVSVHAGWTGAAAAAWVAGVLAVVVGGLLRVPVYGPRGPRRRPGRALPGPQRGGERRTGPQRGAERRMGPQPGAEQRAGRRPERPAAGAIRPPRRAAPQVGAPLRVRNR
ncbi:MraY family glycosyltransferase [Streptomyces echinoruber]|uniref:Glycosyltransferase n=1 Tax=Streptomyces echinoruber TaxID=68898 RepID=A0A918R456_9ACTN|nr:MraY family glycosyltransferase [Streptomyces echinoruber]GGZ81305.1 putative glycosyltransferase [Streptomyces echinoruber]